MDQRLEGESSRTIWAWAEEKAERAMRDLEGVVEATPNEYQRAEKEGRKHATSDLSDIANASDIAGG